MSSAARLSHGLAVKHEQGILTEEISAKKNPQTKQNTKNKTNKPPEK